MYLNKVFLIGNLTRDPELKALPSGSKVASLSMATNRVWKDQAGARQEATEYHNIVAFGRQAENLAQYAKKGSSLFVEGRIQTRSWMDRMVRKITVLKSSLITSSLVQKQEGLEMPASVHHHINDLLAQGSQTVKLLKKVLHQILTPSSIPMKK